MATSTPCSLACRPLYSGGATGLVGPVLTEPLFEEKIGGGASFYCMHVLALCPLITSIANARNHITGKQ